MPFKQEKGIRGSSLAYQTLAGEAGNGQARGRLCHLAALVQDDELHGGGMMGNCRQWWGVRYWRAWMPNIEVRTQSLTSSTETQRCRRTLYTPGSSDRRGSRRCLRRT